MNKQRNHRVLYGLCMVLVLSLLLTSGRVRVCADEEPQVPEGGVIYDDNDVVFNVKEIRDEGDYYYIQCELSNNRSEGVMIEIYPLRINQEMIINDGIYEYVEAGETIPVEGFAFTDDLQFAGMTSVREIQGYLRLDDPETYETIYGPELVTLYTGDAEDDGSEITHSDNMIYDREGIQISYAGFRNDDFFGDKQLFLVSNDTDTDIYVDRSSEVYRIDGDASENLYLSLNNCYIPAGSKALCYLSVVDPDTYDSVPYETIDTEFAVSSEDNSIYLEMIPVHVQKEADAYTVTAEEQYYPDSVLDMMENDQKQKEEEAWNEALEANAEEVQEPVIEQVWIYNEEIGISYNDAVITVMVHNPNERTYLEDLEFVYDAYDADDNLICTEADNSRRRYAIAPGETLPYVMTARELEYGTEVDHVDISVEGYEYFNELELESEKEMRSLLVTTEDIHLDNIVLNEGEENPYLSETMLPYEATISGTLVNEGEETDTVYIILALYNSDGENIVTSVNSEFDLPAESSMEKEYWIEFGVYKLPDYDHTDVYILG